MAWAGLPHNSSQPEDWPKKAASIGNFSEQSLQFSERGLQFSEQVRIANLLEQSLRLSKLKKIYFSEHVATLVMDYQYW